jgi:membrane-associated protease RseP (regulator of RpoE activity)
MIILFFSLLICIILHEAGHLVAAKMCKCAVIRYSIGFGKHVIWSKKMGETIYQVTLWLLGGYCELKDELHYSRSKHSFTNLPYSKKFIISIAGIVVNVVTGAIATIIGLMIYNNMLITFGIISISLGVSNLLPVPAMDGGYIIFYPIFIKKYGQKQGVIKFSKVSQISFKILMWINIASIPFIIFMWKPMMDIFK